MENALQQEVVKLWKDVAYRMEKEVLSNWRIEGKAQKAIMGRGDQPKWIEAEVTEKSPERRT